METWYDITDAKLSVMRACIQFPRNPAFSEEVNAFRSLAKQVLWGDVNLITFKFSTD